MRLPSRTAARRNRTRGRRTGWPRAWVRTGGPPRYSGRARCPRRRRRRPRRPRTRRGTPSRTTAPPTSASPRPGTPACSAGTPADQPGALPVAGADDQDGVARRGEGLAEGEEPRGGTLAGLAAGEHEDARGGGAEEVALPGVGVVPGVNHEPGRVRPVTRQPLL